jgi:hypothetical protein
MSDLKRREFVSLLGGRMSGGDTIALKIETRRFPVSP